MPYVRIDRSLSSPEAPGTRTYKGPLPDARAAREAAAWLAAFPDYTVVIVGNAEAKADVRAWSKAVRLGYRYPTPEAV